MKEQEKNLIKKRWCSIKKKKPTRNMEGHSHILKYFKKKDTHKLGSKIDEIVRTSTKRF